MFSGAIGAFVVIGASAVFSSFFSCTIVELVNDIGRSARIDGAKIDGATDGSVGLVSATGADCGISSCAAIPMGGVTGFSFLPISLLPNGKEGNSCGICGSSSCFP